MKNTTKRIGSFALSLTGIVFVILIWAFAVEHTRIGLLLPSPKDVIQRFLHVCSHTIGKEYTIFGHLLISLKRVLLGFAMASLAGIVLGIAMGRSALIESIFRPIFEIVRPIPSVAWIPLAIVWFGIGEAAKFYIIFMAGFVNITVNTFAGAKQVDDSVLGAAYMLGANKLQTFFLVVVPSCVPYIFAGMQVGLSTCWMAVLAAEMVSSTAGIGWTITSGQENGDMVQIFVGIIAIAVVGLLMAVFMRWLERSMCQWKERGA